MKKNKKIRQKKSKKARIFQKPDREELINRLKSLGYW